MLFFQVLLLAGYFYAHRISQWLAPRQQSNLHIALLGVTVVLMGLLAMRWGSSITPDASWRPQDSGQPVRELLLLLAASIGLPFFMLATTSPLLQRWLADSQNTAGSDKDIYRLYAVSNFGSLLGLASYPFAVEPFLRVLTQARAWTAGYFLFAVLAGICAWSMRGTQANSPQGVIQNAVEVKPEWSERLLWFGLSACGSLILLATTSLVSEDLGVVPLLWVLPLTIYLISFILCFSGIQIYRRELFHPAMFIALIMGTMARLHGLPRRAGALQTRGRVPDQFLPFDLRGRSSGRHLERHYRSRTLSRTLGIPPQPCFERGIDRVDFVAR
jgi:hypothetical protein